MRRVRRGFTRKLRTSILLVLIISGNGNLGLAQSGTRHFDQGGGIQLRIDTEWPDGAGYRPVRVTVVPTVPVTANRTLVFEFTSGYSGWRSADDQLTVTREIELPAGSGPVTTTIAVPYLFGHDQYEYRVGEDGAAIVGLNGRGSFQRSAYAGDLPRVLVVNDKAVNSAALVRAFSRPLLAMGASPDKAPLPTLLTVELQGLPSHWIEYSAVDMVCLSFRDLRDLKTGSPEVFRALREWTAAGGNLLVFDVDLETQQRLALEQLFDMSASILRDTAWRLPDKQQFGQPLREVTPDHRNPYANQGVFLRDMNGQVTRGYVPDAKEKSSAKSNAPPTPPDGFPFASRCYEMGTVVAISSADPFDEDVHFWAWLCNDLTTARTIWSQRHGLSVAYANVDFYNFLIPGVGKAPLNAFRFLITLFVLVIGPVNYYFLRHFRRLHLLVVTVPMSAVAITLALFVYAVFSDGLETRVRVRSVTQINQQTGQTECWARLSYYSGLAPSNGLTFSEDVAVYPYNAPGTDRRSGDRELQWVDEQRMTSGWLRSRTPTQYLTVRSRKSTIGIEVGQAADRRLPITNHLGTNVDLLVLRDDDNGLYWVEGVAEGGGADAVPVGPAEAVAELQRKVNACDMSIPLGVVVPYNQLRDKDKTKGLAEGRITDIITLSNALKGLEPRSYVAFVPSSPEVDLGTPQANPEASLHVVFGSW